MNNLPHCRTKSQWIQCAFDKVTTFFSDRASLFIKDVASNVPDTGNLGVHRFGYAHHGLHCTIHFSCGAFVNVQVAHCTTVLAVLRVLAPLLIKTALVQQSNQPFFCVACAKQNMVQHGSVSNTIHLTHEVSSELVVSALCLGFSILLTSHGHQRSQRMQVFLALSNTSFDSFLVFLAQGFTILYLAQSSDGLCINRCLEHFFDAVNLLIVGGLFRLLAQAFSHTQIEASHSFFIVRSNSGFPLRRANHVADNLAGLWVQTIGFDTNTLLLPNVKLQIELRVLAAFQIGHFFGPLHEQVQLTLQALVLRFKSRTIYHMDNCFIQRLHTSQLLKLLQVKSSSHSHHVFDELARTSLVFFDDIAQIRRRIHRGT